MHEEIKKKLIQIGIASVAITLIKIVYHIVQCIKDL